VRRPDLEDHLVDVAEVDALGEPAFGHGSEVLMVAERSDRSLAWDTRTSGQ
jgi:hypothetical protein